MTDRQTDRQTEQAARHVPNRAVQRSPSSTVGVLSTQSGCASTTLALTKRTPCAARAAAA